jgi:hypothetical protein
MTNSLSINPAQSAIGLLTTQKAIYRVGDRLMATVLTGTPSRHNGGNSIVRIGNGTVQVRSLIELSQGDVLKLQVAKLQPQTLLSVISINGVDSSTRVDPLMPHLIRLQARQGGLPDQLAVLNSIFKQASNTQLQPLLSQYIRHLLFNLASWSEVIQAGGLSQAFSNSGLFLENKLSLRKEKQRLARDFKASLLGLLHRLPDSDDRPLRRLISPPPPHRDAYPVPQPRALPIEIGNYPAESIQGMLREAGEAILARLMLHQIAAAENKQDCWLLELPIRDGDNLDLLHLRIERERHADGDDGKSRWMANLAVDLPQLGPIRTQVNIQNKCISCIFWAEHSTTVSIIRHRLKHLENALVAIGLKVQSLSCGHGTPPPPRSGQGRRALLDTKA